MNINRPCGGPFGRHLGACSRRLRRRGESVHGVCLNFGGCALQWVIFATDTTNFIHPLTCIPLGQVLWEMRDSFVGRFVICQNIDKRGWGVVDLATQAVRQLLLVYPFTPFCFISFIFVLCWCSPLGWHALKMVYELQFFWIGMFANFWFQCWATIHPWLIESLTVAP